VYFPVTSVTIPIVVPFTDTETPGKAPSPSVEEVTDPEMVFCWAFTENKSPYKTRKKKKILFIAFNIRVLKNRESNESLTVQSVTFSLHSKLMAIPQFYHRKSTDCIYQFTTGTFC
jgi:hypothetical protein